jgi:murein DD-endopeptidase MepM/ murein hydrolase activator NlpD
MKTLCLGAVAALVGASLAGCASPHYPISEGGERGPAPLTEGRPQYPIEAARAVPAPAPVAAQSAPKDDDAPVTTPTARPPATVDSQPLPPPSQSAMSGGYAGVARLQYAAYRTEDESEGSGPPPAAPPASTPAATPAPTPAPSANAPALTPQMVIHDQSASPPTPASPKHDTVSAQPAPTATRRTGTLPRPEASEVATAASEPITPATDAPGMSITGAVVHASGVFENYEVQKGDHVDALARAFNTSRNILVDENHLKSPFTLRNGQIIKVPVAKAYVVKSGDTLSGVARRFSVSLAELADLNHLASHADLKAGQQIGLPSSMRDKGPLRVEEVQYAQAPTPPHGYSYTPTERGRVVEVSPSAQPYVSSRPVTPIPEAAPSMSDADAARAAKGRFIWPVRGDIISHFGPMGVGQRNDGVDIKAAQDASVKAAADGQVLYAGNQVKGYGNVVLLQHADGWVTVYAHLDKIEVHTQDQVTQGQELGLVGADEGGQTSLHFEIRYHPAPGVKTQALDPVLLLPVG